MSRGWIGGKHSVFLDSSGKVWTVGRGDEGQLGHGNEHSRNTLQRVAGLPPCVMVSAGHYFTACVSQNGEVYCFGDNSCGQLGQGHTRSQNTPSRVNGLPPIRSLACGSYFVVCVARDSTVWSFGDNRRGQLGLGLSESQVMRPQRMKKVTARVVYKELGLVPKISP